MRIKILIVFLIASTLSSYAQVENDTIDEKYLEDQIYFSLAYNILNNKPEDANNNLFSGGLALGFIKDLPINKRRNVALGIGFGYNLNTYKKQFLLFQDEEDGDENEYETSKFNTHLFEMPFELRWRTSTATKYNFWRIYPGFKIAYLFYSKTKMKFNDETFVYKNLKVFEKFQYGLTLSAGYGTWNVFAYYGLSPIFNDVVINGEKLNLKDFNVGLKFYIL